MHFQITFLSGSVNSQNSRLWSSDNPHSFHETLLHDKKVGVWVAISRRRIVGSIFLMNTISSELYCSDILHAFIGQITSDEINYSWFQQDGATSNTSGRSMHLFKGILWRLHHLERRVAPTFTRSESTRLLSMRSSKICSILRSSAHAG